MSLKKLQATPQDWRVSGAWSQAAATGGTSSIERMRVTALIRRLLGFEHTRVWRLSTTVPVLGVWAAGEGVRSTREDLAAPRPWGDEVLRAAVRAAPRRVREVEAVPWVDEAGPAPFLTAANTIASHFEGICAYVQTGLTNARAEGLNRKIRVVTSRAYGFKGARSLMASCLSNLRPRMCLESLLFYGGRIHTSTGR